MSIIVHFMSYASLLDLNFSVVFRCLTGFRSTCSELPSGHALRPFDFAQDSELT